jgi:hypothetical protein
MAFIIPNMNTNLVDYVVKSDSSFMPYMLGARMMDRSMSKHINIQRRSDPHTLFLYFQNFRTICSSLLSASNRTKIVQFSERMGKICDTWGKGV